MLGVLEHQINNVADDEVRHCACRSVPKLEQEGSLSCMGPNLVQEKEEEDGNLRMSHSV
jgi:hypothetical protein